MHGIVFNYSFSSGLGCYEESRFVIKVYVAINVNDDYGNKIETIGHVEFMIVNTDVAINAGYPLFSILDGHSEYLARHAFKFFDTDNEDYTAALEEHYEGDLLNRNFCFIEKLIILPKYRGYNIGAKAIRDIVFHYNSACGLFVVQPYPLQFELFGDNRYQDLDLNSFDHNKKSASIKLNNYYKSMGFKPIKGIKDLLFYNPALKNAKMDEIDLEDPNIFTLKVIK